MNKCIVCRRTCFYTDEVGWCLECIKHVRPLGEPYLKQCGFEIPDSKTTSTLTTTNTASITEGKSTTECNGAPNGVEDKPQTRIFTDLESEDDDTEPMSDEDSDGTFKCPHCRKTILGDDLDDDDVMAMDEIVFERLVEQDKENEKKYYSD